MPSILHNSSYMYIPMMLYAASNQAKAFPIYTVNFGEHKHFSSKSTKLDHLLLHSLKVCKPMKGHTILLQSIHFPDSFCLFSYHSKYGRRQAVCQSRADQETRGLYTVAYDDTETNSVLGCFSPYGQGWCYFPGPASTLHMSYDTTELRMYNEVN